MNRRRFLSFIGLAPVAAALPAMALPMPDKPTDIDSLKIDVSGPDTQDWFLDASKAGPSRIVINVDALDGDLRELHHWLDVSTKKTIADLKALGHH